MRSELWHKSITRRALLRAGAASASLAIVAGCAPTPTTAPTTPSEEEPAQPIEEVTEPKLAPPESLVLRVQADPDREGVVAEKYTEEHPNVAFDFVHITGIDHEEVASRILSMLAAGQPLDLGFACTEATQLYAGQGLCIPLDEYVMRDEAELREFFSDTHPSFIEALMYEGHLYQMPYNFNAANMYYNTTLFEENGIERPPDDWTVEDFVDIARKIVRRDASGQTDVFGYGWTNRLWGSWMPWIFVRDSNLIKEDRAPGGDWMWSAFYADDPAARGRGGGWRWNMPMANDPRNVEALELMQELTREGTAPDIALGGGQTLQGFFSANTLGMTPAGGFWAGGLHNAGMERGSFDVQLMPRWESQRHQFGVCGLWLQDGSEHLDEAWEYEKFRIKRETMEMMGHFNPVTLTTPTRRSMLNEERFAETGPEHWHIFYDTLDEHPDTAPIPAPPSANPMTTLFTSYTGRAMALEMSAKDALDGMQRELEELFARVGDMYGAED